MGDDFTPSIWQHSSDYEPSMVFPYAVYFAEAMDVKIYALPYNQFIIFKGEQGFEFIDLSGGEYNSVELSHQLIIHKEEKNTRIKARLIRSFPFAYKLFNKLRKRPG